MALSSLSPPLPPPLLVSAAVLCWLRRCEGEAGTVSSPCGEEVVVLSREVTQWITIAEKRTEVGG